MNEKTIISKNNNNLIVKRPDKQHKSNTITIRLTKEEKKKLDYLKKEMKFTTVGELFIFFMEVVDQLFKWEKSNYRFIIENQKENNNLQEVKFEFVPGK